MAKTALPQLIIAFLLTLTLVDTLTIAGQEEELPEWNPQWSHYQELTIPISTNSTYAHYQPIDMEIIFKHQCWTQSINETSIRVLCLYQEEWYELESQIYRFVPEGPEYIKSCSIVFLIPEYADGTERYFIFYHDIPTMLMSKTCFIPTHPSLKSLPKHITLVSYKMAISFTVLDRRANSLTAPFPK